MAPRKVYLVQRKGWSFDDYQQEFDHDPDAGGGVPVRAFASRARAEACARNLERAARKEVSPFVFGDLGYLSSLSLEEFCDFLRTLKVRPPPIESLERHPFARWREWWDEHAGGLSEGKRDAIWDMLDRLRFYEVVETELAEDPS
jgi:hypothetical protein